MKLELSDENSIAVNQSAPVVLLVDDMPNMLRSLTRALRYHSYRST